jgi:hypothetical protein
LRGAGRGGTKYTRPGVDFAGFVMQNKKASK